MYNIQTQLICNFFIYVFFKFITTDLYKINKLPTGTVWLGRRPACTVHSLFMTLSEHE